MSLWTRRHLLAGLLRGAFAALAVASIPGVRAAFAPRAASLARCVDELLPDPASARAIGRLYLDTVPEAMHRTRALASALSAQPDASARRSVLGARRHRDLAAEDVVVIDGWLLAATEAELCALALLVV